jgi:hypothetical protein
VIFILNANRMNRSNSNNSKGNQTFTMVVGVLVFIAICIGLYYLYSWLYNSTTAQTSVSLLSGEPKKMVAADANSLAVSQTNLTGLQDGGQYTTNFWVYVSDTKGFNAAGGQNLAHLLDISVSRFSSDAATRGKTLIFFGLNPKDGSLIVRQSTSDPANVIDNSLTTSTGSAYSVNSLVQGYNTSSTYKTDDRCDIINGIEFQRWIQITAVGNGRTLDVYVDGKLARSCVYKASFSLGSGNGNAVATFGYGNGGNLKGYFAKADFYNYAITPDQVWANYQAGPGAGFTLGSFFSNLFSINNTFGTSGNNQAYQIMVTPTGQPWTYL